MGALNYDGYGGGSGKNSTAPKKTTIPSSSATPPRTYTNPYQEYVDQRHAATTPSAQDYAQLMRSGLHMSYAQYAYEKSHTVFPPYQEYMQGKAMGSPYYVTSTSSSVSCIAYPANHPQYPNQYYVRARNKEEHITSSPKVVSYYDQFICQEYNRYSRNYNEAIVKYFYNLKYVDDIKYDDTGHINGQGRTSIKEMLFGRASAGGTSCETIIKINILQIK